MQRCKFSKNVAAFLHLRHQQAARGTTSTFQTRGREHDYSRLLRVSRAFEAGIDPRWLGEDLHCRYLLLAAFPEDTIVYLGALQYL